MPPLDWQAAGPNEWNFVYSMGGKCHNFKLVVALHEKTGRTFVHASEDGNPNNIQVLGLQLENYVNPDSNTLKTQDWNKVMVLDNEQKLKDMVITHIVNPLKETSEDLELPEPAHGDPAAYALAGRKGGWGAPYGSGRYYYMGAGIALVVVAAALATAVALRRRPLLRAQ
ncbi:hypothetical protein DUNSADRAFT_1320 [Dunaliella salina]|nr:hypothetical protein DUNSADRAFT_1320 [Dunaliella salina]|eukprot:KAF5827100.1 hypothetical protein DUNSADRAFT_1320 [Dunaliella salina]